nr:hypothetical protein [Methylobacterium sp. Leaf122]
MTEQREKPATNAAKRRAVDAVLIGFEGDRLSTLSAAQPLLSLSIAPAGSLARSIAISTHGVTSSRTSSAS